jgi:agmatine deiminase
MNFNGWGGKQVHSKDARVARNVAGYLGLNFTDATFVAEGGAIATDGSGTLMSTESSIVNSNRNPGASRSTLTAEILAAYGATRYIWFKGVKGKDITDDHVDGTSLFVSPGTALVEAPYPGDHSIWATDQNNQASILASSTDGQGQPILVTRLGDPNYDQLPANVEYAAYANMYPCNGAVMMIQTGDSATDAAAKSTAQSAFPGRTIVQIPIPTLSQGGGGIHCVTQQQPEV